MNGWQKFSVIYILVLWLKCYMELWHTASSALSLKLFHGKG